jgi:hypothetical protein
MKITRLLAYRVELPLVETSYKWSGATTRSTKSRSREFPTQLGFFCPFLSVSQFRG